MIQEDHHDNEGEQPPPEVPSEDWASTPDSVRKLIRSLLEAKQEREIASKTYTPVWPAWFRLFLNALIIIVLVSLLVNRVMVQCVHPSLVSVLSAAIILPVVFHIIWRNIYYAFISPNYADTLKENIKVGFVTFPITVLITFFNEIQPWKLASRLLGFLLLVLIAVGAFLNLSSYSPFYAEDEPSLQGFSIERFGTPPERLGIDQPLMIKAGEKVFIEAILLGGVEASCAWSTVTGSKIEQKDCSTVFAVRPGIEQDVLTVIVQPGCGTRQEFANLPITVQP